jgi:hypothetical protein
MNPPISTWFGYTGNSTQLGSLIKQITQTRFSGLASARQVGQNGGLSLA